MSTSEINLSWLFSSELPLPAGLSVEALATNTQELSRERLTGMEALLGKDAAQALAQKLGKYELGEEESRKLGLEGVALGSGGEFPALSPARWVSQPRAESWAALRARLHENGGEAVGLSLDASQREGFLKFLARNRVSAESDLTVIVNLARHFFSAEPLNVVVRYTGPRFHHV